MNVSSYNHLINKPDEINEVQTLALEKVLDEFPYFQSARALRLKGLYNQNSYKYNFALKITAAHSTDRTALFDFITSESFIAIQKKIYEKKITELLDITVVDSVVVQKEESNEPLINTNTLERSILTSIKGASQAPTKENTITATEELEVEEAKQPNLIPTEEESTKPLKEETKTATEKLEIGKPLDFSKSETHSFQQWLQISRIEPIIRTNTKEDNPMEKDPILDEEKDKKTKLIDKFIETSPKISPLKPGVVFTPNLELNKEDHSYLMTETLAKVYLEQKKYQKAIQAYEILILKYPEKSSFFVDRIKDIKIVQQNNN
jgi:tetratricopeptide (TPR) repeat protein